MKTKVITTFIFLSVLLMGCKNEKSEGAKTETGTEQQQVVDDTFKVTLAVTAKKDDNFQVYYNLGDGYNEKDAVWVGVKGMDAPQKVVFTLPKDVIPASLRIDLGMSDTQEDLVLSGIELSYMNKNFSMQGAEMGKFFWPLEPTEADFTTGIVKAKFKDGKRIEPALYSNEELLGAEIKKITN